MESNQHATPIELGRRAAVAGIAASTLLAGTNLVVGIVDRSASVFAAGIELAGDAVASALVLLGLVVASRPPDANHPYGHGRVETLAAWCVGLVLIMGGVGVCWRSLQFVGEIHPPPSILAVSALLLAIVVRTFMSIAKFRIGTRIHSAALVADAWNDTVDILAAVAALAAVTLTIQDPVRFRAADHYGGFAIGLVVVLTGLRVARDASLDLIDTMPSSSLLGDLRALTLSIPGVKGVEKAYARRTGFQYHVDVHVEVDPALTVAESHRIAQEVRQELRRGLSWVADVLVHIEPAPPT